MQNKYETINLDYPSVEDLIKALKKFPPKATICLYSSLPTGIMISYELDDRDFEGEPANDEYVNLEWYDPSPYSDYYPQRTHPPMNTHRIGRTCRNCSNRREENGKLWCVYDQSILGWLNTRNPRACGCVPISTPYPFSSGCGYTNPCG